MFNPKNSPLLWKILHITSWLIADIVFINMAFYSAYLLRFNGIIEEPAFKPYLNLWPYICLTHLIVFYIFKLYKHAQGLTKKEIFINTLNASTISILASISIVYVVRRFYGFIPSRVFIFAWGFVIILAGGWRLFIRYEA